MRTRSRCRPCRPSVAFELGLPHKLIGGAVDETARRPTGCGWRPSTAAGAHVRRLFRAPRARCVILRTADTVIVPGIQRGARGRARRLEDALGAALEGLRARMMSICTGAFRAGRAPDGCDGRPATTHWLHTAAFRRFFPAVQLDLDVLYVDDGDVLTSAATRRASTCACTSCAATTVYRWRTGGPARRGVAVARGRAVAVRRAAAGDHGQRTAATRAWALDRLHEPLTLAELAAHAAMSVRTFTRRFRERRAEPGALAHRPARRAGHGGCSETTELPVGPGRSRAGFGTPTSVAPADARGDRGGPVDLSAHLPRGRADASAAQVASWRSKAPCGCAGRRTAGPVTPARTAWRTR